MNINGLMGNEGSMAMMQLMNKINDAPPDAWPEPAPVQSAAALAFEFDTIELAEQLGIFVDNTPLGASTPTLIAPSQTLMIQASTGEQMTEALAAAGLDQPTPVTEVNGVPIESVELQLLASFHPLTKLAVLEMGEEGLMTELMAYFEAQGMPVPQNPKDPSFQKALQSIFQEQMLNSSAIMPKELSTQLQDGLISLNNAVEYLNYTTTIAPNPGPASGNANVQLALQMFDNIGDHTAAMVDVLKQTNQNGKNEGVLEFMKMMMDALREVKQAMLESQMLETSKSHELMIAKKGALEDKVKYQVNELRQQMLEMNFQKEMEVFQDTMEILMPCLMIAIILISLMFLPFAPFVILLSTSITVALIAVQVSLSQTGKMDEAFEQIGVLATEIFGWMGVSDDEAELIFWILAIVLILAVAVLLILLLGAIALAVVPAVVGALVGWITQYSGIVETITSQFQGVTGWDDDWSEMVFGAIAGMGISLLSSGVLMISGMLRQIIQELIKMVYKLVLELVTILITLVIKIIEMIISMGVQLISELGNTLIDVIKEAINTLIDMLVDIIKDLLDVLIEILQTILMVFIKTVIQVLKMLFEILKQVLDLVVTFTKMFLEELIDLVVEVVESLIETVVDLLLEIIKEVLDIVIKVVFDLLKQLLSLLRFVIDSVRQIVELLLGQLKQIISKIGSIAATAQQAAFKERQADFAEAMGRLEAIVATLDEIIKTLQTEIEKAIGQIDSEGVGEFMEVVNDLTNFIERILSHRSQIMEQLASAVH